MKTKKTAWQKAAKGVQFKEHATRKHGIKPDKYFRH